MAALLALFGGACEATIVVGTECPERSATCSPRIGGGASSDAGSGDTQDAGDEPDAHEPDADEPDADEPAGTEPDASVGPNPAPDAGVRDAGVAGPALPIRFQNPSFELVPGGGAGPLVMGGQMPSSIAPWYACRGDIAVSMAAPPGPTTPSDGAVFVSDSIPEALQTLASISGLSQDLPSSLRAGQRYAFVIDLWSEVASAQETPVELQVYAQPAQVFVPTCIPAVIPGAPPLAMSPPIEPGGWRTTCLAFTPSRDADTLILTMNSPMSRNAGARRLYMDNIRSSPDCK